MKEAEEGKNNGSHCGTPMEYQGRGLPRDQQPIEPPITKDHTIILCRTEYGQMLPVPILPQGFAVSAGRFPYVRQGTN